MRPRPATMALLAATLAFCTVVAFSLGALIGKYRPQLASPFIDGALAVALPLKQASCNVEDVTLCGVWRANRPIASCAPFTSANPRHAVLLVFGQSNSANFGDTRYTAGDGVANFNLRDGKCYRTEDPLFGADGNGGSVWGRLGDLLIASGAFDRVLIVPFGIGGTALREWAPGGRLHPRVEYAAGQLREAGIEPTHVLWHQGEDDARNRTSANNYIRMFTELVEALRRLGIEAPVFPAVASLCKDLGSDTIRTAQRALPTRIEGVLPGPDTDTLSDMRDRYDFCHFSDHGMQAHAALWKDALLANPDQSGVQPP